MKLFSFSLIYSRFNSFQLSYHRGTEDSEMIVIYRSHSTLSQVNVTDLDSGEYYHFRVQARSGAGYGPSVNQSSSHFRLDLQNQQCLILYRIHVAISDSH